ncbi:MAG: sialidase family protein, partial [Acidobacteriota bacterium]
MSKQARKLSMAAVVALILIGASALPWSRPAAYDNSTMSVYQNWEEQQLGLRRPTESRYDQYWRAQLRAASANEPLGWLLSSPAFEEISGTARQFLIRKYGLAGVPSISIPEAAAREFAPPTSFAGSRTLGENIMINDPEQDIDPRVQSQTASAAFGNTTVVVYNHSSDFPTHASVTQDNGLNWQETIVSTVPDGVGLGDGMVAVDTAGNFFVSSMALNQFGFSTIAVAKSTDGGLHWLPAADAVTTEVSARFFHDKPWIAIDTSNGNSRNNVYVSWTKFDDIDERATIMFSRAKADGTKFLKPIEITRDTKAFDVQGSRLAIGPAGEIYLSWLDERVNGIRMVKSTDGGNSFSSPTTVVILGHRRIPQFLNGHFRVNSFPSLAVDQSTGVTRGYLYLAYNARPVDNITDKSDVFLIRSSDGGRSWSEPVRVNNDRTSTDQWMPSVAVTSAGKVALLWYDRRHDQLNNALIDVYLASSSDGGSSFPTNLRVTDSNWAVVPTPLVLRFGYHGDYNQLSTNGELLNLHWGDDRNGNNPNIYFTNLPVDQTPSDDFVLSARVIAVQARVQNEVTIPFESSPLGAFNEKIALSAESSLPGAQLQFSFNEIQAGNGFDLTISVPPGTRAGTYPVIVTGQAKTRARKTTVHVVVLNNNPVAKPARNITETPGDSANPQLVVDTQGTAYMIWQDDTNGAAQILFTKSTDGENFSVPVNISRSFDSAIRPALITDALGRVHIAWEEQQPTGRFIVYTRSDDGGENFIPKRVVSSSLELSFDAAISIAPDGAINMVWTGKQQASNRSSAVFFTRST